MDENVRAGGVIVGPDKRIVLVFQHSKTWGIPKGGVENGEEIETAAVRELNEETGLENLHLIKKLGIFRRPSALDKNDIRTIHLFLFKAGEVKFNPKDVDKPEWFSFEEAVEKNSFKEEKEFLLKHEKEILEC